MRVVEKFVFFAHYLLSYLSPPPPEKFLHGINLKISLFLLKTIKLCNKFSTYVRFVVLTLEKETSLKHAKRASALNFQPFIVFICNFPLDTLNTWSVICECHFNFLFELLIGSWWLRADANPYGESKAAALRNFSGSLIS